MKILETTAAAVLVCLVCYGGFVAAALPCDDTVDLNVITDTADIIAGITAGQTACITGSYYGNCTGLDLTDMRIHSNDPATTIRCPGGRLIYDSNGGALSGFTLADSRNFTQGGAVYVETGVLTVQNMTFSNNFADEAGGAIFVTSTGSLNVINSVFDSNTVDTALENSVLGRGGAVACEGGVCDFDISTFTNNVGIGGGSNNAGGGAIAYIGAASASTISDCDFSGNSADTGGAVYTSSSGTLTVSGGSFTSNTAGSGGAIHADAANIAINTATVFTTNTADNSATSPINAGGGAVAFTDSQTSTVNDAVFTSNVVTSNHNGGGASVYRSASNPDVTFTDCTFTGNSAYDGGAVACTGGASTTCAFVNGNYNNNNAGNDGGGIRAAESITTLTGVIITGNTAPNAGGGLSCDDSGTGESCTLLNVQISGNSAASGGGYSAYSSITTITDCFITDNTASTVGGGLNCFSATCDLVNVELSDNSASSGGGLYALFTSTKLTLVDSLLERNTDGAVVSFLADNLEINDTALFNNSGPAIDALQSAVSINRVVARKNDATSGILQLSGSSGTVLITDSYVGANGGVGFLCGDSDVHLKNVVICGNSDNFECNFGCSVRYTNGSGYLVANDLCEAPFNNELPYAGYGGVCEDVCGSENFCVPALPDFTGPYDGCYKCGGDCDLGADNCAANNSLCLDTESSFYCACRPGFAGDGITTCVDINECNTTADCPINGQCVNTIGSFDCTCAPGYTDQGGVCLDENECNTTAPCLSGTCINLDGSFRCVCDANYYGDVGTECKACPLNSGTLEPGATNITACLCDSGFYRLDGINSTGTNFSEPCYECPPGYFEPLAGQCVICPINTWNNVTSAPSCTACGSHMSSPEGSTELSDCVCETGFAYEPTSGECERQCNPGTYRPSVDSVCVQCEANTYSDTNNQVSCTACPAYNEAPAGSDSLDDCQCEAGFVRVNGTTGDCMRACPKGTFRPQLGSQCISCPAGQYQDQPNQAKCEVCPQHSSSLANSTTASACVCNEGYEREGPDDTEPCFRQCRPGSFRPDPLGECQICGNNFYTNEWNLEECIECPENNVAPPNTTDIKVCECERGYYTPERKTGTDCLICPEGGTCKGGTRPPTAKKGFAPVFDEDGLASFTECVPRDACAGNGECSVGYDGDICQNCIQNYYRLSGYCKECDNNPGAIVAVCVFALWLFCAILVWFNTQERVVNRFASLVIGLNSLQIAAQYGRLDVDWPYLAQRFFDILSIANFNLELVAPECAVPVQNPFALRWVATMMLPLMLAGMFASVYGLAALILTIVDRAEISAFPESLRMTPKYVSHTCLRAMYQIMMIIYLPLSASVFELFDCVKDANGKRVINSSRSTACYDPAYWRLFPIGLLFMILYPIGMPIFYYALLDRKRKNLGEVKFSIRYGFLVGRFQPEFYLFELLIMMRKLGVVLCMAFLTSSPYIKAGGAIIVLQFSLWLHLEKLPYRTVLYNWMETICLFCAILVLLLSMLFQDPSFSKGAKNGTIITVLMVNVLVIVVAVVLDSLRLAKDAVGDGKFEEGYYDGATTEPSRDTPMVDFTGAKATTMSSKSSEHGGAGVNGTGSSVTYDAEGHETIETRNSVFELDKDDGGAGGIVVGSAPAGNGKADPPMPDPPAASSLPHPPVARPPVPGGGPRASGVSGGGGGGGGLPLPPPPASMDTSELPAPPPRRPSKPAPPRPSRPIPAQPPASSQFDSFAEQQQI